MKRIYLRGAAALLSVLLAGQLVPLSALAADAREGGVTINVENFPDSTFRSWLTNSANLSGAGADSFLSAEELASIRQINVSDLGISSLEGIELFPALEKLSCMNNRLSALDVSQNKNLTYLQCSFNQISSLDVSGLDKLVALYCENNHMTSLTLTGATALEIIYCRSNDLPSVDFSTNTSLKFIETFDNRLTSVDLSKLKNLEFVHLDHNKLTDLDLSYNTNLSPIGSGFVARNNFLDTLKLPSKADLMVDPDVYFEQDPKKGYNRVEWYSDPDHSDKITGAVQAQGQTLYAKWLPNDYTIYFSANGGSGSMTAQNGVWGQEVPLNTNQFKRVGYTFQNWINTYGDGQTYTDGQTVTNLGGVYQGQRVTLYAQWTPNTYTVKFDPNGGEGSVENLSCTYNQDAVLPSVQGHLTAPGGKEFSGWATEAGGAVRYRDGATVRNLAASGDVTLYAVWREPVSQKYVQDLEEAFALYQSADYTTQDWNALVRIYTTAAEAIPVAGDENAMKGLYDQAVSDMSDVATLAERADQAVGAWKSAHSTVNQADRGVVTEENAAATRQDVQAALVGLTTKLVQSATGLNEPADQEQVLALEQAASDFQRLTALGQAAAWADGLGGLSTRNTSEVTSALSSAQNQLKAVPTKDEPQQPGGGSIGGGGSTGGGTGGGGSIGGGGSSGGGGGAGGGGDIAPEPSTPPTETVPPTQTPTETTVTDPVTGASAVVTTDSNKVSTQITHPTPGKPAVLTIPGKATPSTVAVLVAEDGTRTVLPWAVPTVDGLELMVSQSCRVELEEREASYSDVAVQSWYEDAVAFTSARGLFSGVGGGRFAPEQTMTRSMLASVLYRMDGAPAVSADGAFSDVPAGRWDSAAVQWAAQSGIVSGTGEGKFSPEAPMTREALVTMLYRYANQAGLTTDHRSALNFTDADSVSSWAEEAVNWACEAGILQGSDNQLRPGATATRAEVASILMRFADLVVSQR
ncbi:hypothetical protein B5G43_02335 [Flavonifractor sp. An92]|uniref:S-layer homology domain-containing protein n=1 Tax=Flavonifractor sp. An92 TaxID=1965666 RepID=UPI000B374B40|nr:S-layer homology domain-containing protein [Flavonifractor sp. An92]OUN08239.1 hypothetical protein B5G43_02335 [Flavonifractor sp. An92]